MSGVGSWLLHGKDIGIPLEIDFSVGADISTNRVNGAKTLGTVDAIKYDQFTVELFKEFSSREEERAFREQMIQFQNGIEFMPFLLETNQFTPEFHEHLVNISEIDMPMEAGKLGWIKYKITFVSLGHKDEFIGYIQFRAEVVPSGWSNIDSRRYVNMAYPVGAMFHSDPPTSLSYGARGNIDLRGSPSSHTMHYQGGVAKERVDGIICIQNGVQLFSPHARIGAGLMVDNGRLRLIWDSSGHITYQRWNFNWLEWDAWQNYPPHFNFYGVDDKGNGIGLVNSRDALFSKLQLKRITTEYIEIEQEFQFENGMVTAIMWHLRRGQIDVQIRARGINCRLEYWDMHNYIKYNHLFGRTISWNNKTQVLDSETDINEVLTVPSFYADLNPNYGMGYVGITNPDRQSTSRVQVRAEQELSRYLFSTRISKSTEEREWSLPLMFYMGTSNPDAKERQAGYLVDANGQVIHRSRVY